MYLNDGSVNKEVVIQKYGSVKNFFNYLITARDMIADVIINNKVLSTSVASFSTDSGYVIVHVDARFALTRQVDFDAININIHQANSSDDVIVSYTDSLTEGIPANDVDADLTFKVGSLFPFNSLKYETPASYFNSMRSENMPKIDFDSLPNVIENGEIEEEDVGPKAISTEDPPTSAEYIDVLLAASWDTDNNEFATVGPFEEDVWRWACVMSQKDKEDLESFGLTLKYTENSAATNGWWGPYGTIMWNNNFTFTPIGVYSDIEGTKPIATDISNFYSTVQNASAALYTGYWSLVIRNSAEVPEYMTWRCRIVKK